LVPYADGRARLRTRELRRDRQVACARRQVPCRRERDAAQREIVLDAGRDAGAPGAADAELRTLPDREDAHILAGTGAGTVRPPGRRADPPQSGCIRLSLPDAHPGDRARVAVPVAAGRTGEHQGGDETEGGGGAMIMRRALPRRTFLRGMGTAVA